MRKVYQIIGISILILGIGIGGLVVYSNRSFFIDSGEPATVLSPIQPRMLTQILMAEKKTEEKQMEAEIETEDQTEEKAVVNPQEASKPVSEQKVSGSMSKTEPKPEVETPVKPKEQELTPGSYGRLMIDGTNINVALYAVSAASQDQQAIVDRNDSATYATAPGITMIGDHKYQGFSELASVIPNQTHAYIKTTTGTQRWICTKLIYGSNDGGHFYDENGNDITFSNPDGIIIFTCGENYGSNIITIWLRD